MQLAKLEAKIRQESSQSGRSLPEDQLASYLMGHPKSAKEISQVAHVSDGTIRGAYKQLYAERESLVDKEWIKDGKGALKNLPPS